MRSSRAVEIVGGGLAGLSLGLALRRAGVTTRIIEAGSYPRHRVCGEFITGLPAATRTHLGLNDFLGDAAQNREVGWFIRGCTVRHQRLPSVALGLSRHALDTRLADAFVAAGGELQTNTRAIDLRNLTGRVFATGRRRSTSAWLGLKIHAVSLELARDLEVHLGDHAYIGLTRIESNRVNICGLFRRREITGKGSDLLLAYLEQCDLGSLAQRLRVACPSRR